MLISLFAFVFCLSFVFGLCFYLFTLIWPSLAGFVPLQTRCQPPPRVARVDGTPAKPDVYIRSKVCGLESASHTCFEENVASSTPRRMAVSDDCAGLQVNLSHRA